MECLSYSQFGEVRTSFYEILACDSWCTGSYILFLFNKPPQCGIIGFSSPVSPSRVGVILTAFTRPSDSSVCLHSVGVLTSQLLSFFSSMDGPCSGLRCWAPHPFHQPKSYILSEASDLGVQSHLKSGSQWVASISSRPKEEGLQWRAAMPWRQAGRLPRGQAIHFCLFV